MSSKKRSAPKVRYKGVRPVLSGGEWKFRARSRVRGIDRYGPLRSTQEEASDDYRRMALEYPGSPKSGAKTLGEALAAATAEAMARNVSAETLKSHFGGHGRYLLKFWKPETPLRLLTAREVAWFAREALKTGRNPNTIIEKDLHVLNLAFQAAGRPSPVREAKKLASITKIPRVKHGLEFGDALQLIHDMRTKPIEAQGKDLDLPARQWHADIAELILWTGARAGEVARLRRASIDRRRGIIKLEGKVGTRYVPMDAPLAAVAARLSAEAKARGDELLVPGGMAFIGLLFRRWSDRLDTQVNARALRHTIAIGMIEAGLSLDKVRDQLGHTSITTTAEYVNQRTRPRPEPIQHLREHFDPPS
ncbi:MAG: site-specific integrase [Planctomycetota bacterium]